MKTETATYPNLLVRLFRAWFSGWCLIGRAFVAIIEVLISLIALGFLSTAGRYVLARDPRWVAAFDGAFGLFVLVVYLPIMVHYAASSARVFPKAPRSDGESALEHQKTAG